MNRLLTDEEIKKAISIKLKYHASDIVLVGIEKEVAKAQDAKTASIVRADTLKAMDKKAMPSKWQKATVGDGVSTDELVLCSIDEAVIIVFKKEDYEALRQGEMPK